MKPLLPQALSRVLSCRRRLLLVVAALTATVAAPGADWTAWRGGALLGVSPDSNLPARWSAEENLLWTISPTGWGDSSPIVTGDRLYLTAQTDDTGLHVLAINRKDGRLLWSTRVGEGKLKSHELHNMATPTPATDGRHVWAQFGTGDLACLDTEGKIVWQRQLQKDHGDYHVLWGMGTSPLLLENRLFVTCLHAGPSYVLALDAATGQTLWKTARDLGAKEEARESYSTPMLVSIHGRHQLVVSGADHIDGYDPGTGRQLWISGGLSVPHPYGRTIASPAAAGDVILAVASGFRNQGHLLAVRAGGEGNITESHRLWTSKRFSPDCPSPVIYQDHVYLIRDDGQAACLDLKTGEPRWQERLFNANVKISPVAGDGKVYFLNGQANCTVVRAGPTFEILATNELKEETLSTPALSQGTVFVRTKKHLYAFGPK